jgi:hypothetical protein
MRRTLKTTFALVASAAALGLGAGAAQASAATHREDHAGPAYFELTDGSHRTFVVKLTDPGEIGHARELLRGETVERPHVFGLIAKRPAGYNRPWNYHLEPDTVRFFDQAIELCDAAIPYVEEHLGEAGGAFLPGLDWCDRS